MANHSVSGLAEVGFVDKRRTTSPSIGAASIGTPANYGSVTALRTRLAAISAGTYTAARLDAMTLNDMQYALRLSDDAASM